MYSAYTETPPVYDNRTTCSKPHFQAVALQTPEGIIFKIGSALECVVRRYRYEQPTVGKDAWTHFSLLIVIMKVVLAFASN